jgi:hypothetical protein
MHAFSLWQREGLGHPVFVSGGVWHPLTLLLQLARAPESGAGPIVGTAVAATGAALCLFLFLGPGQIKRQRIPLSLFTAILLAFQPYRLALIAFGIASAAYAVQRYVASPSQGRWVAAIIAAILGMLATSSVTLPWMSIVVICGVWCVATSDGRRAESALGVVGILVTSALLAAPWWLPGFVIGRNRAAAASERGAVRDAGAWRSLDIGRSAETTFGSDRLARLRPMAIAPSGQWRLGSPFIDYLGIRSVQGSVPGVPRGFTRTAAGDIENQGALPRFSVVTSFIVRHDLQAAAAIVSRLTSFRHFATVDHVPEKVAQLSNSTLPRLGEGALLKGDGASLAMRRVPDGHFVVDVESRGWNLLVSSEPFWTGWRVYWNGERMPPVSVNCAFIGTFVPPGRGTIELRYHPAVWDSALRLCAAGVLLLILTLLWPWHIVAAPAAAALAQLIHHSMRTGAVAMASPPTAPQLTGHTERLSQRLAGLARLAAPLSRRAGVTTLALLLFTYGGVLVSRRVDTAGGADSSGYLNQARLWSERSLIVPLSLAEQLRIPVGLEHIAIPLGFARGPRPYTMVPSYPLGVPLQMALLRFFAGDAGPFLLAPLTAIASLLLFYRLARELAFSGGWAAAGAAILGLCPAFLFFSIQPMSDVVATCWALAAMTCAFRGAKDWRFALLAGICTGFGVLVRPTQLLLLPAVALAIGGRGRSLSALLAGGLPFAVAQMAINGHLYGHPLMTGYGDVFSLVRWENFPVRFNHYSFWLAAILSPIIFPLGLLGLGAREASPRLRGTLAAWLVPFFLFYCFYGPYESWWYTRFLLPAVPSLILSALLLLRAAAERSPSLARRTIVAVALMTTLGTEVVFARKLDVMTFADGERVYRDAARMASTRTPENAVLLTMQHSGACYYYTGRTSLRYDSLTPPLFDTISAQASSHGRRIFALVGEWETPELRERTNGDWATLGQIRDVVLLEHRRSDPR